MVKFFRAGQRKVTPISIRRKADEPKMPSLPGRSGGIFMYKKIEMTDAQIARFHSKVDQRGPDECWLWTDFIKPSGYGQMKIGKKMIACHRIALHLSRGVSRTMCALHRCDVRNCCNPAHLFEGTYADNIRDMIAKGRAIFPGPYPKELHSRGEDCGQAKLTEGQVLEIRRRYGTVSDKKFRWGMESLSKLGREFGLTKQGIRAIVRRESWAHVTPPDRIV